MTAEHLYTSRHGVHVRSAGTAPTARIQLTAGHIGWADLIFVMEKRHQEQVRQRFSHELLGKQIICLHIADTFAYGDDDLIEALDVGVLPHLSGHGGTAFADSEQTRADVEPRRSVS